jgi:hypothetical protein
LASSVANVMINNIGGELKSAFNVGGSKCYTSKAEDIFGPGFHLYLVIRSE